ncbi:DNA polymerase III subunit gamma/tau [Eubacterium callanderi]|uniref:DNA polymerase III subunit gamma/tau n=1 Tax=Eubacterium callanderi TaxID=53442 RepID=UPI001C12744C|nr:DNA polymerase III subunit gamma/tau [Eubacterium callanderi]MBU5302142.1 DNA polymerase III subunit gamma/tau [Eubacterium callanderi]WPK66510.1 Holliday junction ATP-dependent DNA helicase RuvB [Eubacterium callanderi]WPK70808.1 Holliday junction ATP-dependent DNA helicase RuvB [Eubacterium callanderi]
MAYLALYRRYRPQDFDSVVGQEYVTRILKNQILSGRVGHAYLFSGIRGTGKTSIAKIFARAINCEHNEDGNPCNACDTCLNIEKPGVMDIIEIDGASNRGVDEIREIREKVKYPPTMGKYKVYIIDEVHMLTKEAFNALLKTLEEPPEHIVFILATTEPNKLPMTILSRCQRFDIKPISQERIAGQIARILEDIGVSMDREAIDFIAYRGDSSMRDALSLLDQVIDIREADKTITYEDVLAFMGMVDEDQIAGLVQDVVAGDKGGVLLKFKAMREAGRDSGLVFGQLIDYLRKVLIVKTTGAASQEILGITESASQALAAVGQDVPDQRFYSMIDFLIEEKNKLRYSGLASVIVEMALLKLCDPDSLVKTVVQEQPERPAGQQGRQAGAVQGMPPRPAQAAPQHADNAVKSRAQEMRAAGREPTAVSSAKETAALPASGADMAAQETPPAEVRTADGGVNTDNLYTGLVRSCQKQKQMLVRPLMCCKLAHKGDKKLALRFSADKDGQAAMGMLKLPVMFEFVKKTLCELGGDQYVLDLELVEKNYDEMSILEKTKSIINDDSVEVVEVKG